MDWVLCPWDSQGKNTGAPWGNKKKDEQNRVSPEADLPNDFRGFFEWYKMLILRKNWFISKCKFWSISSKVHLNPIKGLGEYEDVDNCLYVAS